MTNVILNLGPAALVLVGLLLPGLLWAQAARWSLPWLAGGVLSVLGIFCAVLVLSGCGVPVTCATLGAWQSMIAVTGGIFWWRQRAAPARSPARSWREWWLALPAWPMAGVAIWRAIEQPLSGADVDFRWNHLAEIIVQSGGLAHYPPVAAADFAHYFWPDGIAPLLASMYAWTYLAAGSTAKIWTALPVLLQVAGLLVLLWALGRAWGGERGGWFACALGGGTMLLQFSFNLGQETGLTALGVAGMAFYLMEWERTGFAGELIPAAACAALVASAREYGLIFPVVAAGWLLSTRAGWRRSLAFSIGALVLPVFWHVRNWAHTGNPFYALDVAGIFPTNSAFSAWMRCYVEIYGGPLLHWSGWREIGRLLILSALPALLGFAAGAVTVRRSAGSAALFALTGGATVVCWLASVPFTAGGLFYSMRVLSPLLLLGCAWGGATLAHWIPGRRHLAGVWLGCLLFGVDAGLRALTIPENPYQMSPRDWPMAGYVLQKEFGRQIQPFLEIAARKVSGRLLTETVVAPQVFRTAGIEVVPVWSPEVAFLFAPGAGAEAAAQLRVRGFSHVLVSRAPSSINFYEHTGAWARLNGHLQPVMANDTFILFALQP
jgi:hypothetical protein